MNTETPFERLVTDALRALRPDDCTKRARRRHPRRGTPGSASPTTARAPHRARDAPRPRCPWSESPGLRAATILAAVVVMILSSVALAAGGILSLHQPDGRRAAALAIDVRGRRGHADRDAAAIAGHCAEQPRRRLHRFDERRGNYPAVPGRRAHERLLGGADLAARTAMGRIRACCRPTILGSDPSFGWSADGSRLLYEGAPGLVLEQTRAGPFGRRSPRMSCARSRRRATRSTATPAPRRTGSHYRPTAPEFAFVRGRANAEEATVVAILDLGTGKATVCSRDHRYQRLAGTLEEPDVRGHGRQPALVADGSRMVFGRRRRRAAVGRFRWTSGAPSATTRRAADLERLTPKGMNAFDGSWSPDGTTLVFASTTR